MPVNPRRNPVIPRSEIFTWGCSTNEEILHVTDLESEEMEALTEVARQYYLKELKGQLEDGLASSYGKILAKSKMSDKFAAGSENRVKSYASWDKAVTAQVRGGAPRTEVPISFSGRIVSVIRDARDSVGKLPDGSSMLRTIFDRLVIFHGRDGFRTKIIRFHPDRAYLERHGFDASHNYLHKLDKDYTGYLEYLNITGERNGLIRVVDGKPVGRIGNGNRKP